MFDLISVGNAPMTMTSREIAELTGKGHFHVMRDIRSMLLELQLDESNFGCTYQDAAGRTQPAFALPRRECMILVSGYSTAMRARIIDRWQELEGAAPKPVELSRMDILKLAMESEEARIKAEAQLAIAAPKAEALDRIATPTEGAVCLRVAAKLLQMPEKQFLQFANAKGFIFRNHRSRIWQGYSDKAKAGLVELKLTTVERDDGSSKTVEQALITHAGIAKLAQMLGRGGNC